VLVRLRQEVQEVSRRIDALLRRDPPKSLQPPDPPLQNDRIRLDVFTQADGDDAFAMVQDPDVKRYTYIPSDADRAYITRWIGRYETGWADGSCAGFSIRGLDEDAYLGFAAIVRLELAERQGEIGYMVPPEARGRGAATGAVQLLTRWGFDELGLERLQLQIDATNVASIRVAERAGYRLDGVLRSVYFKEGRRGDTQVWSSLAADKLPA